MGDKNEERANWAREAMESVPAFREMLDPEEGGPYTAVKDLLCDLMHFCDREGLEFDEIVDAAQHLHDGEVADDE